MSITRRHRDDEDFTVRTDPRDSLDTRLRALPRFVDLVDPDENDFALPYAESSVVGDDLSIPVEVLEEAPDIEILDATPVEITEDAEISIALSALRESQSNEPRVAPALAAAMLPPIPPMPNTVNIHRIKTRELDQAAARARKATLAAERRIAAADGRVAMDDRYPGQGTCRCPKENP